MTNSGIPSFVEWVAAASEARRADPIWSVQAFRLALYAIDCHTSDRRTHDQLPAAPTLGQLTRAVGSVAANIAEGYSRSSLADRNRFYEYALGSIREAVAWYDTLRFELGAITDERQSTLIQVRRLLLTTLRTSRPSAGLSAISDKTRVNRGD